MIDAPTLALASGLDNIALALMASLYAWTAEKNNPALMIWRFARYITGIAFIVNGYGLQIGLSLELAHVLVLLGFSLELAAYSELLGIRQGLRIVLVAGLMAIIGRLLLSFMDATQNQSLIYLAFVHGCIFFTISLLLLKKSYHQPLAQWVGFSNGLAASMMFIRTIRGIWGELLPFATNPPSIPVWVGVLLVTTINGIGFLLLIKQHDDEKLRQALVDLTVAEEEQRQLLSLASHEFRTPAAIIKSSLDSLNFLSQDIPPQVAQRLVNIHKATQRMTHLANTLIAQDRLRHLRFDLIHGDVELSTLIKDVAATYITPLVLRGIEQDITIQADADMLAIALHNLIDNALRHSPEEHPPEIHLCHQDGCVEIRVADQGRGIQDQEKQAIFERFYRRDTDPGSGLGLSIVHKIVSLHHGTVSVQDNQPQGAVFLMRFAIRA